MENYVKLSEYQINNLFLGELVYVNHPNKGICMIDPKDIYINTIEFSEEDKKRLVF